MTDTTRQRKHPHVDAMDDGHEAAEETFTRSHKMDDGHDTAEETSTRSHEMDDHDGPDTAEETSTRSMWKSHHHVFLIALTFSVLHTSPRLPPFMASIRPTLLHSSHSPISLLHPFQCNPCNAGIHHQLSPPSAFCGWYRM